MVVMMLYLINENAKFQKKNLISSHMHGLITDFSDYVVVPENILLD